MSLDLPVHVWVCVTGRWGERQPGILLEWRRLRGGRWEGYVVSAFSYRTGGGPVPDTTVKVEGGWHHAEHIQLR